MRRKTGSIKFRIVAVVILFTLASAFVTVFLSLRQYQQAARRQLLQSTEFNLNLVAGLVSRDLDALGPLRDWCSVDGSISAYISGSQPDVVAGTRAFDKMNEQVRFNRAYQYLLRVVIVSEDFQRILQSGSGTTAGIPLSPYTIDRLDLLESSSALNRWDGVVSDPFINVSGTPILYSRGVVYTGSGRGRTEAGSIFLIVSTDIITDPIANYQLPDGCQLYLTIGESTFLLDGSLSAVAGSTESKPTGDETFDAETRVVSFRGQSGENFLAVSCPVGGTGLWLTQTISSRAVGLSLRGLYGRQLALLCLSAALIGLVVLWVLNQTINRPILRLQARMAAVSEGDFAPDPSIEWDNELGDVGRGVNHLAQSVQGLMERRLADEKARRDLEYQMLQSQINPHFLYNSLNSIRWMAAIQNAPGIAEMTTSLAHLLKSASKGQQTLIPLEEELALLGDYFVIQSYRYGGAINLTEDVPPELGAALLPRFTLQPLLENAIFHGIEPKGGAGTVKLTARRGKDGLLLVMEDDGVGMEQAKVNALLSGEGEETVGLFRKIGLHNVHRRIQYEFGEQYGLAIESEPGRFTRIMVRLPFVTEQPGAKEETP